MERSKLLAFKVLGLLYICLILVFWYSGINSYGKVQTVKTITPVSFDVARQALGEDYHVVTEDYARKETKLVRYTRSIIPFNYNEEVLRVHQPEMVIERFE